MTEELEKRDECVTLKRYSLVLSVWLDQGETTTELRQERRGINYILSPFQIDTPAELETEVIKELCRGLMELEGIEQCPPMAIEALAKMEAIQKVIDMPTLWEQDDRRRYTKIVDIVRKECRIKIDIPSDAEEEK